ncbi:MAG: hypothetical protein AB7V50_06820, partial [Vampirovibrionia bacterium]
VSHVRHIPFFALSCAYFLPFFITPKLNLKPVSKIDFISAKYVLPLILIAISVFLIYASFTNKEGKLNYKLIVLSKSTPQYVGYPIKAVEYIKSQKFNGNMITTFNWGEYIIFNLHPAVKVSFDGRYETVYPETVVKNNLAFLNGEKDWKEILKDYNPDMVLLSKYDRVLKPMYKESGWPLVFIGDESFLFINPEHIKKQAI